MHLGRPMYDNPKTTPLSLRKFSTDDFYEYQRWFQCEFIDKYLGPAPDTCWLDHVLHDNEGEQLSIHSNKQLVAVVGIHFATKEHPTQVITDFAVHPERLRSGIGSQALALLLTEMEIETGVEWQTFIDQANDTAIAFFTKNGWRQVQPADENNMLTFQLPPE